MVDLATAIDPSALGGIKNFTDVLRAGQNNQLQNQAAQIDNASKANIYKTQVLSAAAGSGDQAVYQGALQHLAQNGIDVSDYPLDIKTGAKVAEAGRLAQSPLGSLLNAGLKNQSNQIALSGLTGSITPGALSPIVPGLDNIIPQGSIPLPVKPTFQMPTAIDGNVPAITISPTDTSSPTIINPQPTQTAYNQVSALAGQPASIGNKAPINIPAFQPPPQNPNETLAAYQARRNTAFDEYKLQNAGLLKQAESSGSETGKLDAENILAAKKADELTKRLEMNLNAMLKINANIPSSGLIPASAKVYLSQAQGANKIGDQGAGAKAANQWDQINNQQVLSEIQQFIAAGGANTRINQTLDKIVQAASGIDRNALPDSRESQIKNALAEIKNKNVSVQNLVGNNQQYENIPVTGNNVDAVNPPIIKTQADFDKLPSGATYISTNGQPHRKP